MQEAGLPTTSCSLHCGKGQNEERGCQRPHFWPVSTTTMVPKDPGPTQLRSSGTRPLGSPEPRISLGPAPTRWTPTPRRLVTSLCTLTSSPAHQPPGPALRARPHGHTLNSAMVRLRLYRFSERKLLRELLMKTVTVGADTPVTSISPRPAVARGPVQPSHTGSAEAAAPSGISVPPPAAKRANASAPTSMLGQSLSSSLRRRAGSANPERPSVAPGSANSCKGGRPGGREEADTKKKGASRGVFRLRSAPGARRGAS